MEAYDLDVGDQLTFEIEPVIARKYLRIDTTGNIYIRKSVQQLSPSSNRFGFKVIATDLKGESGNVNVELILVQLIPGAIIIREVNELHKPGDGWFIKDLPHQYLSSKYKIVFPRTHPFKIGEISGMIGLQEGIDYESQRTIIVEESNVQRGGEYMNYKVRVPVVDANDNKPYFTMDNFMGKVNKNAQPGT